MITNEKATTRYQSIPTYTLKIAFGATAAALAVDYVQGSFPADPMEPGLIYGLDKAGNFSDAIAVTCGVDIGRRYVRSDRVGQSAVIMLIMVMAGAWESTTALLTKKTLRLP